MLEKLDLSTLLLEEEEDNLKELVALQSNHSTSVEDLRYARSSLVFSNVKSNLQFKYLNFCLRFFKYFKLDSLDLLVESYKNILKVKNNLVKEENINIVNSLAIRYSKAISSSTTSSSSLSKNYTRQVSSISSDTRVNKKIKTLNIINLSSIQNTSSILSSILQEFLQDN